MKTKARILAGSLGTIALLFMGDHWVNAQVQAPAVTRTQTDPVAKPQQGDSKPKVIKESEKDGTLHRITGKAKVLDAHTIVFEDGTEVDLNGVMDAPELEQKALIGDSLYPCGKEAADFLKKLIGDQMVTFLPFGDKGSRPRGNCYAGRPFFRRQWYGTVGRLRTTAPRNWRNFIAQENKRGLWRGKFITPKSWRKGERLPGE